MATTASNMQLVYFSHKHCPTVECRALWHWYGAGHHGNSLSILLACGSGGERLDRGNVSHPAAAAAAVATRPTSRANSEELAVTVISSRWPDDSGSRSPSVIAKVNKATQSASFICVNIVSNAGELSSLQQTISEEWPLSEERSKDYQNCYAMCYVRSCAK